MKLNGRILKYLLLSFCIVGFSSCKDHLTELNKNPNGPLPENADPIVVIPTVLTEAGKAFNDLGFGDVMGVMQYTQKDGHGSAYNNYSWGGDNSWDRYYNVIRNIRFVRERSHEMGDDLGVGMMLVMHAMVFGLITDLYGDVPYEEAIKAGQDDNFLAYTTQEAIYSAILDSLDVANQLLSKDKKGDYLRDFGGVDVFYNGEPKSWRKLANSLALRYYMRLSEKSPEVAKAGIEKIVDHPDEYPIITTANEDAVMSFPGNSTEDAWPNAVVFDADQTNYRRVKMAKPFVSKMLDLEDPRLPIWAERVEIPIKIDNSVTDETKEVELDGEMRRVRFVSESFLGQSDLTIADIDTNSNYVGLPIGSTAPQAYNLSPDPNQSAKNPHVSWLNPIYKEASGPLLKARLLSAAEVHFIIAEAKTVKGWTNADAETEYEAGIQSSFEAWGVSDQWGDYYKGEVVFDGSQEQIITQKWIAGWTAATEPWFDYRRTGFPDLRGGKATKASRLPIRFYYPKTEQNLNKEHMQEGASHLEPTQYSPFGELDEQNSPWSKMWVAQVPGIPYD